MPDISEFGPATTADEAAQDIDLHREAAG